MSFAPDGGELNEVTWNSEKSDLRFVFEEVATGHVFRFTRLSRASTKAARLLYSKNILLLLASRVSSVR